MQAAESTPMIARIALDDARHAPRLEDVLEAAAGCFEGIFAERIRRRLIGYYSEIAADHVKEGTPAQDSDEVFVSRSCNPAGRWYAVAIGGNGKDGDPGVIEARTSTNSSHGRHVRSFCPECGKKPSPQNCLREKDPPV